MSVTNNSAPSYIRTGPLGGVVATCVDANRYADAAKTGVVFDKGLPTWATKDSPLGNVDYRRDCPMYAAHGTWCEIYGDEYFNPQGVSARQGCCTCGGGQRTVGTELEVTVRDPLADGDGRWGLIDMVNVNESKMFNTTDSGERFAHSTNIYEPPSDDWCVAQRVDTATFVVYVFDEEPPELTCQPTLVVCNDNQADTLTATNYATIRTERTVDAATGSVNTAPDLYPSAVTDNVNSDMVFATGATTPHPPLCAYPADVSESPAPAYAAPASITATRQHVSATTVVIGSTFDDANRAAPLYLIGTWRVEFHAIDTFQNEGTCTVDVTVKDCTPPNIVCPPVYEHTKDNSCHCTIGGPSLAKISATDNSGVPPRLTLSKAQGFTDSYIDRDYKFPIGITRYWAKAVDMSGAVNSTTGDHLSTEQACTVVCQDLEKPQYTCPPKTPASGFYTPPTTAGEFNFVDINKVTDNSEEPVKTSYWVNTKGEACRTAGKAAGCATKALVGASCATKTQAGGVGGPLNAGATCALDGGAANCVATKADGTAGSALGDCVYSPASGAAPTNAGAGCALNAAKTGCDSTKVRTSPSWPRSWANFSLL
jgi:hypothetical protein